MDRDKLEALAVRCEAATGPDPFLTTDIADFAEHAGLLSIGQVIPQYTESLDAAMTLVPEGWLVEKQGEYPFPDDESRPFYAILRDRRWGKADNTSMVLDAATPALALTAAALRSHKASME